MHASYFQIADHRTCKLKPQDQAVDIDCSLSHFSVLSRDYLESAYLNLYRLEITRMPPRKVREPHSLV
ncbi:MAG: hypothetical protein H6Q63_727 [Firmicutes bacterium]|nr:hypothetical protein [Bacillota bacterium]